MRALRSILEDLLLDLLYELPARKDTRKFLVTEDVVSGEVSLARGLTADDLEEDQADADAPEGEEPDADDSAAERETA